MRDLSFAEIEAVLAEHFVIASAKRAAFRSRIKALEKYGIPNREKKGRGVPSSYSGEHLLQLAVALELTQAGLTPQTSAQVVRRSWWAQAPYIYLGLTFAEENLPKILEEGPDFRRAVGTGWAWCVYADNFADMMEADLNLLESTRIYPVTLQSLNEMLGVHRDIQHESSRSVVLNTTFFFLKFAGALEDVADLKVGDLLDSFGQAEEGLAEFAELCDEFMGLQIEQFLGGFASNDRRMGYPDAKNLKAKEEELRGRAHELIAEYPMSDVSLRATNFLLSQNATYELSWILTSPEARKSLEKQTGEVLDRRREGQVQLKELGLIDEASEDAFYEPSLTAKGLELAAKWAGKEPSDVNPKA